LKFNGKKMAVNTAKVRMMMLVQLLCALKCI